MYRMNLARVWEAMGRYPEAIELYGELAALMEARSGPMSLGVISSRNNIAACFAFQGRHAEAEPIFRDVWEKSRVLLGESNDMTLGRQHNLAQTLHFLGRNEEAFALQERVVALTAPGHPRAAARQTQLENLRARLPVEDTAAPADVGSAPK